VTNAKINEYAEQQNQWLWNPRPL